MSAVSEVECSEAQFWAAQGVNVSGMIVGSKKYYRWNETTGICWKKLSFFDGAYLPEASGYAIVLGFGLFFSLFTTYLVYLDNRYIGTNISSEFFNTAGRTVKTGLTAAVIVSQWTWAATLLQSSNVAYSYGVSGPFWYASGATIQVLLFGILAIQVKRFAPNAHTICEIIDARWGSTAHKVFLWFCLLTNIIVSSMLILGGADTVNALTGMDVKTAGFLIPIGVIVYTMAGGLKATFMASYLHTSIIFAILVTFLFTVYADPKQDIVGDPSRVYKNLLAVASSKRDCQVGYANQAEVLSRNPDNTDFLLNLYDSEKERYDAYKDQNCGPVADNQGGEYLTMLSKGGIIFGIINIVGNFGTVFVDQSYWQSAIAAKPSSSTKGYLLGGLVWFTIPFALATAMGLATVALDLPVTVDEANRGLVPPAAAVHFFDKGGAAAITIMLFMAITSTGSAEQIAVSSLIAYDIYKKYINPKATGKQILTVSRFGILGFGLFMGVLSIILQELGLTLGFVYLMMGIFIGSAVVPVAFVLTWDKASASGAIIGALTGQVFGIITWIVCSLYERDPDDPNDGKGTISIGTLGNNYPMLAGNVMAICSSGLIHAMMSYANPQNFDFETLKDNIELIDDKLPDLDPSESDPEMLISALAWIKKWGIGFTIIMVFIWPCLSLPAGCGTDAGCGVFSESYFYLWVIIALVWGLLATIVIIGLPLYESFGGIQTVFRGMMTNDDVHMRLDILEAKLDQLIDPSKLTKYLSDTPCYRARLIARKNFETK